MSQYIENFKPKTIIRNSIKLWSKDWFLKVISLCLAVVLWVFIGGEDTIEKTVRVPVEIINLPRDLVISNQYKKEIEVSVTGPRSVILEMDEQKISRQVDMSAATPGTVVVENDNEHIIVPRSVTVQRVQPASVILSVDKLLQKNYPVVPNTVGSVAPGYEVREIVMKPDFITITGPATVLGQLTELQSRYISINDLEESVQMQIPLNLNPVIVDLIGETSVTANIEVVPITVTETVRDLPVSWLDKGVEVAVVPNTVSVTAKFPQLLLESGIKPEKLLAQSVVRDEETGKLRVMVTVKNNRSIPIEIISIIPAFVSIEEDVVRGDLVEPIDRETIIEMVTEEGVQSEMKGESGEIEEIVVPDKPHRLRSTIKKKKI